MHPVTFVVLRACATSTFVQWNPGDKAMGVMTVFLSIQILLHKVCLAFTLLMSTYSFCLRSVANSIHVHWCTGSTEQVMVLTRTQGCGLCAMITTLLGHLLLTFSTSILWFAPHNSLVSMGINFCQRTFHRTNHPTYSSHTMSISILIIMVVKSLFD